MVSENKALLFNYLSPSLKIYFHDQEIFVLNFFIIYFVEFFFHDQEGLKLL